MNIAVVRSNGSYYTRPDTTMERESRDFYVPDDCESVCARRCVYARIVKAGKAVATKFAGRYLDGSFGEGVLLYGVYQTVKEEDPYIDYSTFLFPASSTSDDEIAGRFAAALEKVTRHTSVRIGDVICIETDETLQGKRGDTLFDINLK